MKINKRLMQIVIVSAIAATIIVAAMYYFILSLSEPEPVIEIYTYSRNIDKGTILSEFDINKKDIPKSLYSYGLEDLKENIVGKKIAADVNAGEYIYTNRLTERGRIVNDFDNLYLIGIDVTNISNLLGTQLKEGDTYYLLKDYELESIVEDRASSENLDVETIVRNIKVTVISLIDNTGNVVLGEKSTPIKTVTLGVRSLEDISVIKKLEKMANITLIRYPIEKEENIAVKKVDHSKVNTKIITLKNGVMLYVD